MHLFSSTQCDFLTTAPWARIGKCPRQVHSDSWFSGLSIRPSTRLFWAIPRYANVKSETSREHLPSTQSANGYLRAHRVFLSNRAGAISKDAIPPPLSFGILRQIHDLVVNFLLQLYKWSAKKENFQYETQWLQTWLDINAAPLYCSEVVTNLGESKTSVTILLTLQL